jgi:hypothetical protein
MPGLTVQVAVTGYRLVDPGFWCRRGMAASKSSAATAFSKVSIASGNDAESCASFHARCQGRNCQSTARRIRRANPVAVQRPRPECERCRPRRHEWRARVLAAKPTPRGSPTCGGALGDEVDDLGHQGERRADTHSVPPCKPHNTCARVILRSHTGRRLALGATALIPSHRRRFIGSRGVEPPGLVAQVA